MWCWWYLLVFHLLVFSENRCDLNVPYFTLITGFCKKQKSHQQNQDIYSENKISSIVMDLTPDFNTLLSMGDPVGIKFPNTELSNDL